MREFTYKPTLQTGAPPCSTFFLLRPRMKPADQVGDFPNGSIGFAIPSVECLPVWAKNASKSFLAKVSRTAAEWQDGTGKTADVPWMMEAMLIPAWISALSWAANPGGI